MIAKNLVADETSLTFYEATNKEWNLPTRPGEMLEEEFLKPLGLTKYRVAKETGLSEGHIGELISGKRNITAASALRLGVYFGTGPEIWLNLQQRYDIALESRRLHEELARIHPNESIRANLDAFDALHGDTK